jgi:hypothetical protein
MNTSDDTMEIMTTTEAVQYALDAGVRITYTGIVGAAQHGRIPGARKFGRDWVIPLAGMIYYLEHRSTQRPK